MTRASEAWGTGGALCAYALGVVLLVPAGTGRAEDTPPPPPVIRREIRVRLACDEEWRAQSDWEAVARRRVEAASAVYEKTFGIRWQVADVVPWTSNDAAESLGDLLRQVERDVPRAGVDLALGFTMQTHPAGSVSHYEAAGMAKYYGPCAIVGWWDPAPSETVFVTWVLHELGHVLGAWHCTEWESVMQYSGGQNSSKQFDPQSAAVIELARDIDFAKGVDWFDDAQRGRILDVFRSGHLEGELLPSVEVDLHRAWRLFQRDAVAGRAAYRRALAEQEACAGLTDLSLARCLDGLARAVMSGRGRDLDEAERLAKRALTIDLSNECRGPPLPDPETLMADVLWERGRRDEALEHYAAALQGLSTRRSPWEPGVLAAGTRLHARRLDAFTLDGRPAWTRRPWRVVAPLLPPATSTTFEAPEPGNLHLRRAPLVGTFYGTAFDAMSETLSIAAPAPGELTIELREVDGKGESPPAHRVAAHIEASSASAAASAVAEVRFLPLRTRETTDFLGYSAQLVLRPAGDDVGKMEQFRCKAPGRATVCIDRAPIVGNSGFLRLPCATSLVRSWHWVGTTETAEVVFKSDTTASVDGVRLKPDGTGAQRTWRLELTFVADGPK